MYTRVLSACPLLGGLSSSFIGGFTIMVRTKSSHFTVVQTFGYQSYLKALLIVAIIHLPTFPYQMYVVHEDMGFKSVDSVREIKEGVYNVCGVKHSPKTVKFCTR